MKTELRTRGNSLTLAAIAITAGALSLAACNRAEQPAAPAPTAQDGAAAAATAQRDMGSDAADEYAAMQREAGKTTVEAAGDGAN